MAAVAGLKYERMCETLKANQAQLAMIQKETQENKKKLQEINTSISNLNDPRLLEQEARKLGWVLPYEHRIRMPH